MPGSLNSHVADQEFGRKAVRGGVVLLVGQGAAVLTQILSITVLARLLTPRDYGLVAMVVAVAGIAQLFRDLGLSTAVVREKSVSRDEQSNLFWVNTGMGFLASLLVCAAAPLLAAFYGEPLVLMITLMTAPVYLLGGMSAQFRADLTRSQRFGTIALVDTVVPVLALAAAVWIALVAGDYRALIVQQIVATGAATVLLWVAAGWMPRWYRRDVSIRRFIQVGLPLLGSQILHYVGQQLDVLIAGRVVGAAALGEYDRGKKVIDLPLKQLVGPINTVVVPTLAPVQDDDELLLKAVRRGQTLLGYALVVPLAMLIVVMPEAIRVVLGTQWDDTVSLARLVAVAAIATLLSSTGGWIYIARGLTRSLMSYTAVSLAIRGACLLVGAQFGVLGVAVGYATAPLIAWPISLLWVGRVSGLRTGRLLKAGTGFLALAAAISVPPLMLLEGENPMLRVTVCVGYTAALLTVSAFAVPQVRDDMRFVVRTLKKAAR